jgi:hypothetical protein
MKRLTQLTRAVLILGLVLFVKGNPSLVRAQTQSKTQEQTKETKSTRDAPPDTWPYTRSAVPEDSAPKGIRAIPLLPAVFIVDAVVNNTDPNLANTDTFNDGETSIAINAANPDEVVMTAFSGGWARTLLYGTRRTAETFGRSSLRFQIHHPTTTGVLAIKPSTMHERT